MKTIKDKILEEAHEGYVCTGNGDPELCYLCECIKKSRDLTLTEVEKVIGEEKKIVKLVCLGLVHPSEANQEEFTKWLQGTVNFHINQIEQKLRLRGK